VWCGVMSERTGRKAKEVGWWSCDEHSDVGSQDGRKGGGIVQREINKCDRSRPVGHVQAWLPDSVNDVFPLPEKATAE
jgi:hypothetical protein